MSAPGRVLIKIVENKGKAIITSPCGLPPDQVEQVLFNMAVIVTRQNEATRIWDEIKGQHVILSPLTGRPMVSKGKDKMEVVSKDKK